MTKSKKTNRKQWNVSFFDIDLEKHITVGLLGKPTKKQLNIVRNEACKKIDRALNGVHSGLVRIIEIQWNDMVINKFWDNAGRLEKIRVPGDSFKGTIKK